MKHLVLSMALLYSVFANAQSDSLKIEGSIQYVFSFSGLNMRSAPSTDAYILNKLTHGTEVNILSVSTGVEELGNRKSRWMKVEIEGQEGYLFGGYLSEHEPPHLDNLEYDCHDREYGASWLEDRVKAHTVLYENYEVVNPEDLEEECREVTNISFESGERITDVVRDISRSLSLRSESLTFNDVLNFMDYYAACRDKWCSGREGYKRSIIVPLRDDNGNIKKLSCNVPYVMTAERDGEALYVKMNM